jgi:hypothetical protein
MSVLEIHFFCDVTCYWVSCHRRFEECCCVLLRGRAAREKHLHEFGLNDKINYKMHSVLVFFWGGGSSWFSLYKVTIILFPVMLQVNISVVYAIC